jgi:large subunit ribosomal protein L24
MKFKKGDEVIVTSGKDRGKKGKVAKVIYGENKVLIPNLNINKRHLKKKDEKNPGGIIEFSKPIPLGNVMILCPKCGKPTRVGFLVQKNKKVRICKKCEAVI